MFYGGDKGKKNSQRTTEKKWGKGNSFPDTHYCNAVEIRATGIWNRDRKNRQMKQDRNPRKNAAELRNKIHVKGGTTSQWEMMK